MVFTKKISKDMKKLFYISLFFSLVLASCNKKQDENVLPEAQYLVQSELVGEFTGAQIKARYANNTEVAPFLGLLPLNTVKVYNITYNTVDVSGNAIIASGALIVPVESKPYALVSYQHGTITADEEAPSNYQPNSESYTSGTLFSAAGYVVSMPDYIGYGASKNLAHPYEHAASLASASRDMLRASREFCARNNVALNNQLFLAGYSEGGYASMALHKLLETSHHDEFTVTASIPGAGAYNKTAFAKYVVSKNEKLSFINAYLWVLDTYNDVYKLNRSFDAYINEPYASQLANATPAIGIQIEVEQNPQLLFKQSFLDGVRDETDAAFLNATKDNDIYNWTPKAPIRMFHGTADDFVPFFNSQNAYDAMRANGATQVELIPIEGGNHFTSIATYTLGLFNYLAQFNQ
ncbi:lipoprotein, putative [Microscilla marina ATCC 23134]|uniref:Lipoprotein, putative n=1 Tax=Microscilla marina ATCC 23134 TaxID=313606 RepID=A1ZCC8_MICM2|nr:lipoprotein, putative [Microscilla marina ATCC 23134]